MNKHVRKILITKIKNNFSNKFTDFEFRNKLEKYLINDKKNKKESINNRS
jgi:hypothetical protein